MQATGPVAEYRVKGHVVPFTMKKLALFSRLSGAGHVLSTYTGDDTSCSPRRSFRAKAVHLYIVMKHIVALSAILAVLGRTTDYGPLPFVHPPIHQSNNPVCPDQPSSTFRLPPASPSAHLHLSNQIQLDTSGYNWIQPKKDFPFTEGYHPWLVLSAASGVSCSNSCSLVLIRGSRFWSSRLRPFASLR